MTDRVRDAAKLLAYSLARPVAPRLPRRVFYALCDALGLANWLLHASLRRRVRANLQAVYGGRRSDRAIARLTRAYFRHRAAFVLESLLVPSIRDERFDSWFVTEGADLVRQLASARRGAVIPLVHFGPFSLVGARLAAMGLRVTNIAVDAEATSDSAAARAITRARYAQWEAGGGALVDRARFLRRVLETVRRGEAVSVFLDAPPVARMTVARLVGRDTLLHRGPATIALATGAPILLMAAARGADRRIHVHVARVVEPVAAAVREERIRRTVQIVADHMTEWIDRHPEQWIMWKEIDERWLAAPPPVH